MTREDLEAAARRDLTQLGVPSRYHNAVIDHFLRRADDYAEYVASDPPEVTQQRRLALHQARHDIGGNR